MDWWRHSRRGKLFLTLLLIRAMAGGVDVSTRLRLAAGWHNGARLRVKLRHGRGGGRTSSNSFGACFPY